MIYINRKFTSLAYSITLTIFAYCIIYTETTDFQPIKLPKQSYNKKTASFRLNSMEIHQKHQYYKSNYNLVFNGLKLGDSRSAEFSSFSDN